MAQIANIANVPEPSKERGQRSIPLSEAYFARFIPSWSQPSELLPNQWRGWVKSQPIAVACKDTIISNISDLDWKITPRVSDQWDELRATIEWYEKLLRHGGNTSGLDWVGFLELALNDLLDLPFGSAWEVGRKGDAPDGRVMWLKFIDGGTCYPTNNDDTPVYQYYNGFEAYFPKHAIARMYMNPRTEIERSGWGIAPPERIFLAMEMIARGDRYYANLLLDIPPVGVFDMADITWDDANTWIQSFRMAVSGVGSADSFKIPVLAEHTGDVKFIPLGKAPNDIMYDRITLKYASLVTAGYGMNLGDLGVQSASSSGETLAGSIRGEQKTNRTGKARVKGKIKYFVESFLPPVLQFDFIDSDAERLSMMGRARLANATAFNQFRQMGSISPEEARLQAIQDGLFTISMPEKPPKEARPVLPQPFGAKPGSKPPERPGQVGSPQPPSMGGDGEVKKAIFKPADLDSLVEKCVTVLAPNFEEAFGAVSEDEVETTKSLIENSVFSEDDFGLSAALGTMIGATNVGSFEYNRAALGGMTDNIDALIANFESGFPAFLGRSIVYNLVNSNMKQKDLTSNVQQRVRVSIDEYAETFFEGDSNG